MSLLLSVMIGSSVLSSANTDPLLEDLSQRAVRFFWEQSHPETGFTKDRASNDASKPDTYSVASVASTGFALSSYPIGVERKWLNRGEALARTRKTLKSLLSLHAGHKGWFYHFVDWKSGERQWKCELSTIDSSILLAGVLIADSYWKDAEVSKLTKEIFGRIDWNFFLVDTQGKGPHPFLNMGWRPEKPAYEPATWAAYNELLMLYIQAYGASDIRTDGWDAIRRDVHTYEGHTFIEGGPLFMHQMSHGFYDFGSKRDRGGWNYWIATREATLANRAQCIKNPNRFKGYGANFWGISACDTPDGYRALGTYPSKEDNGTITPTSAVASLPYTPKASLEFAKSMRKEHPAAWGRYGFPNGYCPQRDWIGPDVIGIDLGMMLLGIENFRDGLPWKLSMAHPIVKKGFQKAGFRADPTGNSGALRQ